MYTETLDSLSLKTPQCMSDGNTPLYLFNLLFQFVLFLLLDVLRVLT